MDDPLLSSWRRSGVRLIPHEQSEPLKNIIL